MAELIVRRRAAWYQDWMRDYIALVDGSERGRVGNDAEVRVHVEPGRHRVQMKIDWCGSPAVDVDVPEGAAQVLDCGPNATPLTAFFYVMCRAGRYLTLQPGARHGAVPDLRARFTARAGCSCGARMANGGRRTRTTRRSNA